MTGMETAKSPQSIACWRKVILFSADSPEEIFVGD